MIKYREAQNALHVRLIDITPQEYLFVLQVVLGEDVAVAWASVYDTEEFKKNVTEDDESTTEYLQGVLTKAKLQLQQQNCQQLKDFLSEEYQRDIQEKANTLSDFRFTGADIQRLLNNLLHERTQDLSEASIREVLSLVKTMYDSGILDSGDAFEKHFITIPAKYSIICPRCNHEAYAVEGLDFVCPHCHAVAKWNEEEHRFYPELPSL